MNYSHCYLLLIVIARTQWTNVSNKWSKWTVWYHRRRMAGFAHVFPLNWNLPWLYLVMTGERACLHKWLIYQKSWQTGNYCVISEKSWRGYVYIPLHRLHIFWPTVEALRSQLLVLLLVLIFAGKIRVDAATACVIPLLPFVIDCSE